MYPRCCRTAAAVGAAALALVAVGAAGAATLPNGRAYELVSPPEKYYGVGVGEQMSMVRTVRGGDSVFFDAFQALPGGTDGMGHDSYRADRGPLGWAITSLTPATDQVAPDPSVDPMAPLQGLGDDGRVALYATSRAIDPADQDYDAGFGAAATDLYLRRADGTYVWVTQGPNDPAGYVANTIDWGWLSDDGSTVVFESQARLLPEDAGRTGSTGLYDWRDGTLHLVGVDDAGTLLSANEVRLGTPTTAMEPQEVGGNAVSRDGRRIFFTVDGRVYVRIDNAITRSVAPGSDPAGTQEFAGATPDGSVAYFVTTDKLTADDLDTTPDLYAYDVASGGVTRISKGSAPATDVAPGIQVSDDGKRLYFQATGALTPDAPDGTSTGSYNLYLADGGQIRYVASVNRLQKMPGCGGLVTPWEATPDGEHVVWLSTLASTPDDQDTKADVFEYSAATGKVVRVSGSGDVGNGSANARFYDANKVCGDLKPAIQSPRVVSDDGRFVFFQTAEPLVSEDTNGLDDIYQHDLETGKTSLLSAGTGDRATQFFDSSPSGRDVFIATFDALVPQDIDTRYDLYDARIGGGFPDGGQSAPCRDDDCQGPSHGGVPGLIAPGSATVTASASPPHVAKKPTLTVVKPSAASLQRAARTGRLTIVVRASAAGKVAVRARAASNGHLVTVGSQTTKVTAGKATGVTVRLSTAARRHLRRHHRLLLSVQAVLTPGEVVKSAHLRLILNQSRPHSSRASSRSAHNR